MIVIGWWRRHATRCEERCTEGNFLLGCANFDDELGFDLMSESESENSLSRRIFNSFEWELLLEFESKLKGLIRLD